ncbi:hypothetical protein HPB48_004824 [Haemaphysalis longicornis]|uniref:Uncharacterized protein n=1 Tax=Haemaphysalis longicornis TaxID=44386 RepID=A0A9J6GXX1_HAELO|nr:hypothetical protein HPB48_004824 [Haemaphysalis longicornis]
MKYKAIGSHMQRIHVLGGQSFTSAAYATLLDTVEANLSTVNNTGAAHHFLMGLKTLAKPDKQRGIKFKVQLTSLARPRPGLHEGSARVPAGRPRTTAPRRATRRHSLSQSIGDNVAGAKTH